MTQSDQLSSIMRAIKVGDTLKLRLFRDGGYREVAYVLPERPLLPGDLPENGSVTPMPRPDTKALMRRLLR